MVARRDFHKPQEFFAALEAEAAEAAKTPTLEQRLADLELAVAGDPLALAAVAERAATLDTQP